MLYTYANVMQQPNGSSCGLFTIAYSINIAFGLNLEQSIYIVQKMQLHFHNNLNSKLLKSSNLKNSYYWNPWLQIIKNIESQDLVWYKTKHVLVYFKLISHILSPCVLSCIYLSIILIFKYKSTNFNLESTIKIKSLYNFKK